MKTTAVLLTALSLTLAAAVSAEPTAKPLEKTAAKADIPESGWSNGAFLGPRWWLKNPKKLKSVPNLWLYHGELSYAYGEQTGNLDVTSHRGKADFYLRKGLLTSLTSYSINNRDTTIKLTDKDTSVKNSIFRQGFRYAVLDNTSAVLGFLREQNSSKYIDSRQVWYGGVRYVAINSEKHDLMLGLFYAPETETRYMSNKIQEVGRYKDFQDVEDYSSDSVYLAQRYEWQMTDVIGFSQSLDYMKFLEDSDYYFLKLNVKLDFKFNKNASFFVAYEQNYDNNSFIDALDQYLQQRTQEGKPSGEIETTDTSLNVGIKYVF